MAEPKGDQGYLGIDTSVLVAYLADDHPQHPDVGWLTETAHAVNPTIIHEAYHTLVFKRKWHSGDTRRVLEDYLENAVLVGQALRATRLGLMLAERHGLGGRDALILASFLAGTRPLVDACVTLDQQLLTLTKVSYGGRTLRIIHPRESEE